MKYRADIDGLRAVAVISIVIFHLGLGLLPGGFVGVDIFFVISGYLIAKIIYAEIHSFSVAQFYVRRARRILPALLVVLVVSSAIAGKLSHPTELVAYAKSAIAAVLFSANIYFYSALNYFSPSADEIPLLHLWSLGVEEQFYIFFPLIAVAIARRSMRSLAITLLLCMFASLGASMWMLKVDPAASFYLIPFRAFELLIGCTVALPSVRSLKSARYATILSLAGAAALAWAIFAYDSFIPFPGIAAVLPCLGAALIIYAGDAHQGALSRLLGSRPLVYVGKISYSLYLVHWPILVFFKRAFPHVAPYWSALWVLLAAFILASVIYYCVEQPSRRSRRFHLPVKVFSVSAVAILSVVLLGGFVVKEQGFPGNVDSRIANIVAYGHYDLVPQFRSRVCFLDPDQHAIGMNFSTCLPHGGGEKVMLWGDSHAAMLATGLGEAFRAKGYSFGYLAASACAPAIDYDAPNRPNCREFNDIAFPIIEKMHPSILIMTAEWGITVQPQMDRLDKTIKLLSSKGIKIVLLGISPYYKRSVPQLVLEKIQAGRPVSIEPDELKRDYLDPTEQYMKDRFSNRTDVKYISVLQAMCPQYNCPLVTDGETPVHFDQAHLTVAGSRLFARELTPLILN
jgi:peptidoglycan/LPS O-acetylase OafA/YrhL